LVPEGAPGCQGWFGINGPPRATKGHQCRLLAPLLGGHAYASGVPVVARGGPWWPMVARWYTRRCPRVPGVVWHQWATTGHHGPSVVTIGAAPRWARVRVRWCQRWPVVAHGGPWWPGGTRRCPRVPGVVWHQWATTGHQGPPVPTVGDAPRWARVRVRRCQQWPAVARGGPWWPMVARWYQKVPQGARGGLASMGHHGPSVVTIGAAPRWARVRVRWCQRWPAVARGGPWWPVGTRKCPRVPGVVWHQWATTGHHGQLVPLVIGFGQLPLKTAFFRPNSSGLHFQVSKPVAT
jgi:hypothetical protein